MTTDPNPGSVPPPSDSGSRGGRPSRPRDVDAALEAEISAALGDMSVEDLLDTKSERGGKQQGGGRDSGHGGRGGRQVRTGKVFRIHAGDVFIEFGPRSQGVCPLTQFPEPPQVGEELDFVVERLDAFEGLLVLSRPGAVQKADWGSLEIGQVVEARCIGMNKGGLEMEVAHHKGFMPAGMVDVRHVPDISVFIGEKFPCQIVELNKDKNRLILSRKAVIAQERAARRDQLLTELAEGQIRPATIISLQPYGAFADLGGVDGLIHISDLTHDRIKHPSEAVKEGEVVQVKIKRIDRSGEAPKISLSRKETMSDPLAAAITSISRRDRHRQGDPDHRLRRLRRLAPGVEGLVHISEVSHERIPTVDKVLKKDGSSSIDPHSASRSRPCSRPPSGPAVRAGPAPPPKPRARRIQASAS